MKKVFLFLSCLLAGITVFSQNNNFPVTGTATMPEAALLVGSTNGDIGGSVTGIALRPNGIVLASTSGTTLNDYPLYLDRRGTDNNGVMMMLARGGFYKAGIGVLGSNDLTNNGGLTFSTITGNDLSTERMRIQANGNVGIGTTNPAEMLSVNGKIRAKEIKVETSGWPDFVFQPGYNLLSLPATAAYIKTNGIELGEMNKKLLQKVEELTLHLIEKDKQINQLLNRMKKQEDRIILLELNK